MIKATKFVLTCMLVFLLKPLCAQVVQNQNFDLSAAFPLGWVSSQITSTGNGNDFSIVTTGTNPACTPVTASNMIKYDSYAANNGDDAILVTQPWDLSNRAGNPNPTISLRIFRSVDAGNDRIEIFANNQPNLTGASLIGSVYRNSSMAGTGSGAGSNGWNSQSWTITNAAINYATTYIIIRGVTGAGANAGGNVFIDNFSIDTWPNNMAHISADAFQNNFPMGQGAVNQEILKLEIYVNGAANPCALTALNFNTNGTTDLANILNARIWFTQGSDVFQAINQFGATVSAPFATNFGFTGSATLVNGYNYFWLTYSATAGAATGNRLDADWIDYTLNGNCTGTYNPLTSAPPDSRFIDFNYCIPTSTYGTSTGRYISDVELVGKVGSGSLLNNNSCKTTSAPWYAFYAPVAGKTTTLEQGATYTLKTRPGNRTPFAPSTAGSNNGHIQNILAWIDFNRNGNFEDWERIYDGWYANGNKYIENGALPYTTNGSVPCNNSGGWNAAALVGGNFVVPNLGLAPANWGPTRMRVRYYRYGYGSVPPNTAGATSGAFPGPTGCGNYTGGTYGYGETEDYIVTISPPCANGEWLGWTKDWSDPLNWCDGIPTLTTNVNIPAAPIGGNQPFIYSGTTANANNLTIALGAKLSIVAPRSASLNLNGTLTNNGTIDVAANYNINGTIGTGKLFASTFTPFRGSSRTDHKIQMIYYAAELTAKGFVAGDVIDALGFQVMSIQSGSPLPIENFKVSVAHTALSNFGAVSGPWSFVNVVGSSSTPLTHTPSCGGPCPVGPGVGYTGPSTDNMYNLTSSFAWDGVNNIVVEACFNGSIISTTYQVYTTQTTGSRTALYNTTTTSSDDGCAFTTAAFPTGSISDFRPNLVLSGKSPVTMFPIRVKGDWTNNGTFIAGLSEVVFNGAAIQNIQGSSPTTFKNLYLDNSALTYIRMNGNVIVDSLLNRNRGILDLNGFRLTLKHAGLPNLAQTTAGINHMTPNNVGWILAETKTPQPMGWVQWNLGLLNVGAVTSNQARTFPFVSSSNTYLGLDMSNPLFSAMDVGNVSATTYPTPANNLPLPPGVVHISNNATGLENSLNTVDRFWIIERTGTTTSGGVRLRWQSTEDYTGLATGTAKVQMWKNPNASGNPGWMVPLVTTVVLGPPRAATVTSNTTWNNNGGQTIYAVANNAQPLPIELLSFDATLVEDEVFLKWSTASERSNRHFIIEKTRDGEIFNYVGKVEGSGNSLSLKEYNLVDPNPYKGLSYYRLTQVDLDGTESYSDLVSINYERSAFDITFVKPNEENFEIGFSYNSQLALELELTDALGRRIENRKLKDIHPGYNVIMIDKSELRPGVYFLTLNNGRKIVSAKLIK